MTEKLNELKAMGWAMALANEFDYVPDMTRVDYVCELFGDEHREMYIAAISNYEASSLSDLTRIVMETLKHL